MFNMDWQLKDFIVAGIFSALTFAIAFLLGSGIILATGIPATGGIANIFAAVFVMMIGIQLVRRFGFATLTLGLMFLYAIPTVIGGPPGVYKVVIGVIIGFSADLIAALGRYRKGSLLIAGAVGAMVSITSIYIALVVLELPGVERLEPLLLPLTVLQGMMGLLAAYAAYKVFESRLKNLDIVNRYLET